MVMDSPDLPKDPRQRAELEMIAEVLTRGMGGDLEGAEMAHGALQDLQMDVLPEPDKYRIQMGKPRSVPAITFECPSCHRVFTTEGGGVAFFEDGEEVACQTMTDLQFAVGSHQMFRCKALEHRWWRVKWGQAPYTRNAPWVRWVRYFSTPKEHRRK